MKHTKNAVQVITEKGHFTNKVYYFLRVPGRGTMVRFTNPKKAEAAVQKACKEIAAA